MKSALFTLAILLTIAAKKCRREEAAASLPACVLQKIDSIKAQPKWNPPATVTAYTYEGRTVYVFSAPCCDQYNTAYDSNCNRICAPSGGLTGKGDRQCLNFPTEAKELGVVWRDER